MIIRMMPPTTFELLGFGFLIACTLVDGPSGLIFRIANYLPSTARTPYSQIGLMYISVGHFLGARFELSCKFPSRSYLAILAFGFKHFGFKLCPLLWLEILNRSLFVKLLFFKVVPNSAEGGE